MPLNLFERLAHRLARIRRRRVRVSKYVRHQGVKECARRVRQVLDSKLEMAGASEVLAYATAKRMLELEGE